MDLITTHINADFDCLGAMAAAKLLYPDAVLVFAGAQEPALREFLTTPLGKSLVFNRSKEIDFSVVKRLILVDVNTPDRIGPFAELYQREDIELHIYDHHPLLSVNRQAAVTHIESVGSTVTVLTKLLQNRGIVPDDGTATMMMLGLYEDTGSLMFPNVTQDDYAAAGFLHGCGADLNQVSQALIRELSVAQVELLHQLLQSLQLVSINGVDVYLAQASIDCYVGDVAVLAHKIRDMEHIDVLIVAVRLEDRVFLVARSRIDDLHVGQVMSEFGGGGHATAASATVRHQTLVEVMTQLPKIIENNIVPHCLARHLMSAPVRFIEGCDSIHSAREMLTRYHVNGLAVVERGVLVGILSRQIVERAVHHGLSDIAVSEYMTTEFGSVASSSPLDVIQQLVAEQHQRFVPVVDHGELVGVVTRADLLRHTVSQGRKLYRGSRQVIKGDAYSLTRRHVTRLLDTQLPADVRQRLKEIAFVADKEQLRVYAVGGFVRDLLLHKKNLDIDIVVEGDAIEFAHLFAQRFDCRVSSHQKFITAVMVFDDDFKIDVASTRTEHYLEPGALPLVEEASIKLDLYRRDFVINTLALSLNESTFGELLDHFGAQRDLHDKAIRVLHNLSFVEDPTRVFRAVRFEQRLGFKLGMHTERLLRSAVSMGFLERVKPLRLFNELMIILKEETPFPAVQRLADLNLLQFISQNLSVTSKEKEHFTQADKALNWFEFLYLDHVVNREVVYFLCLTATLDIDEMQQLCRRLCIAKRLEQLFVVERESYYSAYHNLERQHHRIHQVTDREIYHQFKGASSELVLFFMAITPHETVRSILSHYVTKLQSMAVKLTGDDLMQLGIERGPKMGELLKQLLDARLDRVVVTREDEVNFVVKRQIL